MASNSDAWEAYLAASKSTKASISLVEFELRVRIQQRPWSPPDDSHPRRAGTNPPPGPRKIQIKISEVKPLPWHSAAPKSERAWGLANKHLRESLLGN